MTRLSNFKDETKIEFLKIFSAITIVLLLCWGAVSFATSDVKSGDSFSAIGIVSYVSDTSITINEAKGSDKTNNTTYNLNIENIKKIETNKYVPLNLNDIKVGDKIIAQGLTDNGLFFIKRIISFVSTSTPVVTKDDSATSTASTTIEKVEPESASSTATSTLIDSTSTPVSTLDVDISTTTDEIASSTSTSTVDISISTTTDDIASSTSTSTSNIIDNVVDVIENIIDTVTGVVETVVDVLTNETPSPVPSAPQVLTPTEEDIPIQQLIDNSQSLTTE